MLARPHTRKLSNNEAKEHGGHKWKDARYYGDRRVRGKGRRAESDKWQIAARRRKNTGFSTHPRSAATVRRQAKALAAVFCANLGFRGHEILFTFSIYEVTYEARFALHHLRHPCAEGERDSNL